MNMKRFYIRRTLPPGGNHFPTVQNHELEDGGHVKMYARATSGLLDGHTIDASVDEYGIITEVHRKQRTNIATLLGVLSVLGATIVILWILLGAFWPVLFGG